MYKNCTKQKFIFVAVICLIFFIFFFSGLFFIKFNSQKVWIKVGSKTIQVEIVNTPQSQIKGLSGRKNLNEDFGMLFNFDDYRVRTFWMKNMNFPLDIIWINEGVIVGVDKNALPEGEVPQKKYYSPGPVNQVLEVNAGWFDRNKIMIGQIVSLIEIDKNF